MGFTDRRRRVGSALEKTVRQIPSDRAGLGDGKDTRCGGSDQRQGGRSCRVRPERECGDDRGCSRTGRFCSVSVAFAASTTANTASLLIGILSEP